ncbi:ferredoxin [Streptomyces sp. NPDC050617]|uniref:ferredoxin n=1 Tax=Streptomyces sp. NPDC050617 TaxID=3154628 RepID=UPI003429F05F
MTWHIDVDRSVCIGSGICAGTAPELFRLEGERARAVQEDIEPQEGALDVADSCPALAITITEGTEVLAPRD